MLAFDTHGSGEPLVLVHGLATTRLIWRRVVPLLRDGREITALDVPGFGESPPAGPGFELEAVADVIAEGLAHIDGPIDLVGHSLGGSLVIALAERHPERVRKLVLVAPAGLRRMPAPLARVVGAAAERAIPVRRFGAPLADTEWGRRLLMSPGTADPASIPPAEVRAMLHASAGAERIADALRAAASADLRERLARLPMPVGAIWGERDRIIPSGGVETLLAARPGAPVQRVPGTGHIPMMERPQAFAAALVRTLRALSPTENITEGVTD
ncbi:alpha/beta fold hydrolase [Solirubrobacter sp. CPCC 204708]|uniref:Alpha/beta fold hydrolase n=1 Tax=Solirubrobacter deserti TaxID=2282478 RepID=A0ABT4RNQ0_9ACTN|nr:alpha/beta fold hydrolase [Solirubrobacter deserti]MBE2314916.1 alpha/beta fold hydrolase [Solirubrobacter deserti]MDA0140147.1 alpha/beta fold hydrolase [Solirubrobacter deserti]